MITKTLTTHRKALHFPWQVDGKITVENTDRKNPIKYKNRETRLTKIQMIEKSHFACDFLKGGGTSSF